MNVFSFLNEQLLLLLLEFLWFLTVLEKTSQNETEFLIFLELKYSPNICSGLQHIQYFQKKFNTISKKLCTHSKKIWTN